MSLQGYIPIKAELPKYELCQSCRKKGSYAYRVRDLYVRTCRYCGYYRQSTNKADIIKEEK